MNCDNCNASMKRRIVDYEMFGVKLGKFEAIACDKCGEKLFDEETSNKIDRAAKEKGIWGLQVVTKVGKTGDSFDVRINKKLADFVGLAKGQEIVIYPEGKNKLVIFL